VKIPLNRIAHGRSGDKGDTANIGIISREPRWYPVLLRELTADRVKAYFGPLVRGRVERYELPNIDALNFVMYEALDGGGTLSLRTDAQGKTLSAALLRMNVDVTEEEIA
jgi:hypothetical protein